MPCWQERRVTMEFRVENLEFLVKGLKSEGFSVYERFGGVITVSKGGVVATIEEERITVQKGEEKFVNEIKRAYSRANVKNALGRYGFGHVWESSNKVKVTGGRRLS